MHVSKPKTDPARLKALEVRVEKLETEIEDMRISFLKALARAMHGPSQPPPALTGPQKEPSKNDDTDHKNDRQER